jgi:hypothetical protein
MKHRIILSREATIAYRPASVKGSHTQLESRQNLSRQGNINILRDFSWTAKRPEVSRTPMDDHMAENRTETFQNLAVGCTLKSLRIPRLKPWVTRFYEVRIVAHLLA